MYEQGCRCGVTCCLGNCEYCGYEVAAKFKAGSQDRMKRVYVVGVEVRTDVGRVSLTLALLQ